MMWELVYYYSVALAKRRIKIETTYYIGMSIWAVKVENKHMKKNSYEMRDLKIAFLYFHI